MFDFFGGMKARTYTLQICKRGGPSGPFQLMAGKRKIGNPLSYEQALKVCADFEKAVEAIP